MEEEIKKPKPSVSDPFVEIIWFFLTLLIIIYFINALFLILSSLLGNFLPGQTFLEKLKSLWIIILPDLFYLALVSIIICILCIIGIIYLFRKLTFLREVDRKLYYPEIVPSVEVTNPKWARILNQIESLNQNDWKQAILEADNILAEILEKMGLHGESIGDKLKSVEKSDFITLDSAWEAHKVRNQIAHEGSSFILTERHARQVIDMYRTVFEEFHII